MLMEPDELLRHVKGESALRILDARAPQRYLAGHLPEAVNLPAGALMQSDGTAQSLISIDRFAQVMQAVGVNADDRIVVYGERGGTDAAYVFWALDYYGHDNVFYLNGGIEGWQAAGGELTQEISPVSPGSFVPEVRSHLRGTADEIHQRLQDGDVQIVDVRTPQEYSGELAMTARGGHIPGARRVDWDRTLDESMAFRSEEDLQAQLEQAGLSPDKESFVYCLGGPRATLMYVALKVAGFSSVKVYDRSWSEWGNRSDLPVATGMEP